MRFGKIAIELDYGAAAAATARAAMVERNEIYYIYY